MTRPNGLASLLALLLVGAFAMGCGNDDDGPAPTTSQIEAVKEQGAREAKDEAKLKAQQKQVKKLRRETSQKVAPAPVPEGPAPRGAGRGDGYYESAASVVGSPVAECADGVRIGPNTTCAFAMNVAGEYGSNPGAMSIRAHSPVTGQKYRMACRPWSDGTVCLGGNNSSVFLP